MAEGFQTDHIYPGVGGVDLRRTKENVQPLKLTRMTNLTRPQEGAVEPRPGQARVFSPYAAFNSSTGSYFPASSSTGGVYFPAEVHSMIRLNDPITGRYTRVWGLGTDLWMGRDNTEPPVRVDTGFSGEPLSFALYRPPLSSESWLYVGDPRKMVKLRVDELILPVGLAPPPTPATSILAAEEAVVVEDFSIGAMWRSNAGTGSIPSAVSVPGGPAGPAGANYTRFQSAIGSTTGGYYNYWNRQFAAPVNMTRLGSSGREASDSDLIQFWIRMDRPDLIDEVKVYFVISNDFSLSVLPGTSGSANTNAYVKSFRPTDFTNSIENVESAIAAAAFAKERSVLTESLTPSPETRTGAPGELAAATDQTRVASAQATFGRDQWIRLAQVGFPLRRGQFLRIGNDPALSWSTVRGMVISVLTNSLAAVQISFDDLQLTGGHGPDSSQPGSQPYDYIYRHFDPRTGTRSNFSPAQGSTFRLDALRRAIIVTPEASSLGASMRQEFFRRGGSLVQNYFFVGRNGCNGCPFTDSVHDAVAQASGLADFTNNQPVTTVRPDGSVVRAQPLRSIWGPMADVLFGCGDPHRPGDVYWCKVGEPDHWPVANRAEVCAPSEELLVGHVYQAQSWVFSRHALYSLIPAANAFSPRETACKKGPLSPWATCSTPYGLAFVTFDGVYITSGGPPTNLTDDDIWPLFNAEDKTKPINGYFPIDFSKVQQVRLTYHANELWLFFEDTAGRRQVWVFYFAFKIWRNYEFFRQTAAGYSEEGAGGYHAPVTTTALEESEFMGFYAILPLVPVLSSTTVDLPDDSRPALLLGAKEGKAFKHEGTSDDGEPIAWDLETASLNQGMPRETKQYGDAVMDMDRQGAAVEVEALVDEGTLGLPPVVVADDTLADPEADGS